MTNARSCRSPWRRGAASSSHSLLLHGTAANRSSRPRRAITMSYMAAEYQYTGKPSKPDYLHISGHDVPGGV